MLKEIEFTKNTAHEACDELVKLWNEPDLKVFALRSAQEIEKVRDFYESLFPSLGTPIPLAEDVKVGDRSNQRTGEIWMEVRYDPNHPDAYRHSANAQPLHTDGSYIPDFPNSTLLVCVANAGTGGETTFIDSKEIYKSLENEAPELLKKLLSTEIPHARSGDNRTEYVIKKEGDDVFVNWNYYCVSRDIDSNKKELVEEFQNFLLNSPSIKSKTIGVKLNPGDAVTWKDNYLMHGRNSFVANKESERFIWKCAFDVGKFDA